MDNFDNTMTINEDGSVTYLFPDGEKMTISKEEYEEVCECNKIAKELCDEIFKDIKQD